MCELGLFEDAVDLALAVDLDLAKAVASGPEDDDTLRRKLWLGIAKHVVQQGQENGGDQAAHIKQAVDFLKEAGTWTGLFSQCLVTACVCYSS